jgi:hypothetical protein
VGESFIQWARLPGGRPEGRGERGWAAHFHPVCERALLGYRFDEIKNVRAYLKTNTFGLQVVSFYRHSIIA